MPDQTTDLVKEVAVYRDKTSQAEAAAEALTILKPDDLAKATELLGKIKTVGKAISMKKESITKPMNEALRNARSMFAPIEMTWAKAEAIVKQKMVAFQDAETAKAAKQVENIEARVERGTLTPEKAEVKIAETKPQTNVTTNAAAAQFRTVKEVVIDDETKIPHEYFTLDMVKVRKVALAGVKIAGVSVVEKRVVAGIVR